MTKHIHTSTSDVSLVLTSINDIHYGLHGGKQKDNKHAQEMSLLFHHQIKPPRQPLLSG